MQTNQTTKILVIDDEEIVRMTLADYLRDNGNDVLEAASGHQGIEILQRERPDIILSDLRMPGGGGRAVIEAAARQEPATPVIVISGTADLHTAVGSMRDGAWDFLVKPVRELTLVQVAIDRCLERARLLAENQRQHEELEERVALRTAELEGAYRHLETALEKTVRSLCAVVTIRDPYTAGHNDRVADLVVACGRELKLDATTLRGLRIAGLLHDIGKVGIPAEILNKPARLTDLEYALVKTHPSTGYEIIKDIPFAGPVAEIVLQHHERLDGSGYPQGLSGADIHLEARLLAVCDVYEALTSHRPYRPAWSSERALEFIIGQAGSHFDPACVQALLAVAEKPETQRTEVRHDMEGNA